LQLAATAESNALCAYGNGRRRYTAEQRWEAAKIFVFFFFKFFTREFQRENESKTERKEAGFKTYFLALFVGKPLLGSICWQAPSRLCLLASSFLAMSTPFNGRSNTSTLQ